jgi:hypothetical protein
MPTKRNRESKNQPIGDKDKKFYNVKCYISNWHCHLLSTFMIEVENSNELGIKRLRILNTFGNLKGHPIFFLNSLHLMS